MEYGSNGLHGWVRIFKKMTKQRFPLRLCVSAVKSPPSLCPAESIRPYHGVRCGGDALGKSKKSKQSVTLEAITRDTDGFLKK
jgi:hypothetical protein